MTLCRNWRQVNFFWRVWWVRYLREIQRIYRLSVELSSYRSSHKILMSHEKSIKKGIFIVRQEIEIQGSSFRENSKVKVFPFYNFVILNISRTISRTRKHDKWLMESLVSMHELLSCFNSPHSSKVFSMEIKSLKLQQNREHALTHPDVKARGAGFNLSDCNCLLHMWPSSYFVPTWLWICLIKIAKNASIKLMHIFS